MGLKNLITNFAGLKLKNPVFLASGVGGICGEEYSKIIDLNRLGGFITKTITLKPRNGNPPPRIFETPYGIINNIGLENPGIEEFLSKKLPVIRKLLKIPVIVSIGGETVSEFVEIVKKLKDANGISGYELNLSCPNIRNINRKKQRDHKIPLGLISQNIKLTYEIVSAVKKNTNLPVIAKLSPAVSDITKIALACKTAGADAVSLINSYPVIAFTYNSRYRNFNNSYTVRDSLEGSRSRRRGTHEVGRSDEGAKRPKASARAGESAGLEFLPRGDRQRKRPPEGYSEAKPILSRRTYNYFFGGLSGPAIKPIALRMVYEVANQVKIPVMGLGGITSVEDAMEFFYAGATTIAIGSGIFGHPELPLKIISQLKNCTIFK